ncbi:MAG: hypothetical protein OXF85_02560 [Candidatus Saccharibacteria bacterium]|nr:hypothetical protein [Candidatus Saccharibacteria bacterium]
MSHLTKEQIRNLKMLYALFEDKSVVALALGISRRTVANHVQDFDNQAIDVDFTAIAKDYERAFTYMLHKKGVKDRGASTLITAKNQVYGRGSTQAIDIDEVNKIKKIQDEIKDYQ